MMSDWWLTTYRKEQRNVCAAFAQSLKSCLLHPDITNALRHPPQYRRVRMRQDAVTLLQIQKMPTGDALGDSESCMHTVTVHAYNTTQPHNAEITNSFVF